MREDTAGYIKQLDKEFWQQVEEETKINDLVSAQTEQPLSLFQTLPTNFIQFTAKSAPISVVHRGVTRILMWKRPRDSVVAMVVYSMYCLRPNLLLATPLGLMIAYIIFNYYNSGYADSGDAGDGGSGLSLASSSLSSPSMSPPPSLPAALPRTSSTQQQRQGLGLLNSGFFNIVPLASVASPAMGAMRSVSSSGAGSGGGGLGSQSGSMGLRERKRSHTVIKPYPQITSDRASSALPATKSRMLVRSRSGTDKSSGSSGPKAVDLERLLGVASFGSAKYTDNVHTTQTITGSYVQAYDWVAAHHCLVDWSQPQETRRILALCLWMQAALVVVVYWVPWYLLFLGMGNAGLLAMSPHVRAFARVYGAEVLAYGRERVEAWVRCVRRFAVWRRRGRQPEAADQRRVFSSPALLAQEDSDAESDGGYRTPPLLSLGGSAAASSPTKASAGQRGTHLVSVFENQRWWLGLGWIPRLGSGERGKWSDESGKQGYASLSDFLPGAGYEWADGGGGGDGDGWEIDREWALPVVPDDEGWVYTDNFWKRPAQGASPVSSYTRRRKWVRRVRPRSRPLL
ncbi:hypothetical protein GGF37_001908 [Kickxella alabastrina]|nr:hypothetical protein GGF37_001908 [Kickxella alabastrina]